MSIMRWLGHNARSMAPLLCLALAFPCLKAEAAKGWHWENAPDTEGDYDLKAYVSPAGVAAWTICDTKSFSVTPSDKDYWVIPGTECPPTPPTPGSTMNGSWVYVWGSTTTRVERIGSGTGSNESYRALQCGANHISVNVWDDDTIPTGDGGDRIDNYDVGHTSIERNIDFQGSDTTIVKLGPDFTGHAAPTSSPGDTNVALEADCGGDYGTTNYYFLAESTSYFDIVAKTKSDCRWYPQVTKIHIGSNSKTCTANHNYQTEAPAPSFQVWCAWNCINDNYPTFKDEHKNVHPDCTDDHENYHATTELEDAIDLVDIDDYFDFSVAIVCDTMDDEFDAKLELWPAAEEAARDWALAVGAHIGSWTHCKANIASAACKAGLVHTYSGSAGTCPTCEAGTNSIELSGC